MNEVPFYLTKAGRQFYEVTSPELVRQLHRLCDISALHTELLEKLIDKLDVEESKDPHPSSNRPR